MRKLPFTHLLMNVVGAVIFFSALTAPAKAQLLKTYVSSAGNDNNSCAFSTPCVTLGGAFSKTLTNGEINCVGANEGLGTITIDRTVTIDCSSAQGTAIFGVGPIIQVNGAGVVATVRNVIFTHVFSPATQSAIDFVDGAELVIENCLIHNFGDTPAVRFKPSALGSQLRIINSTFDNNGTAPSSGGGLQVAPNGGSAGVVLDHVTFGFNVTAMVLNSSGGTIGVNMKDSIVSSSRSNGILAQAGSTINFIIDHSSLSNNVGNALQSSGANSHVFINDSTIFGNDTGVSAVSGGIVLSYKNNRINGNNIDGTPLAAVPGYSGTGQ
jgi:hypothetical protein